MVILAIDLGNSSDVEIFFAARLRQLGTDQLTAVAHMLTIRVVKVKIYGSDLRCRGFKTAWTRDGVTYQIAYVKHGADLRQRDLRE